MTGRRLRTAALVAATWAAAACGRADAPPAERPGNPLGDRPATTIGAFDPAEVRATLRGHWEVYEGKRLLWEFVIDDQRIQVVDRRFAQPTVREGALVIRSHTGFGLRDADDVTYYYAFVPAEDGMRMGLGDAIWMGPDDGFTAHLGAWERLQRTPDGCTLTTTWAGQTTEREVKCGFTTKDDRAMFFYEAEDKFRRGRLKTYELFVSGEYLVSPDLYRTQARRKDAPQPPAPDASEAEADAEAPPEVEAPDAEASGDQ